MTPDEKKIVKGAIEEMIDSFHRVAAERDLQKGIIGKIKEDTTVDPKLFRKIAKVAYQSNYYEERTFNEEFEEMFDEVMGVAE